MSFAKKAFHGTVLVVLIGIVSNFLAYALRLLLARELPQDQFGLFYAVVAVVGILYIATHLGLNDALTRQITASRVKEDNKSTKSAIMTVIAIQMALAIVVVGIIALISKWMGAHYFKHASASTLFLLQSSGMLLLPFETIYLSIFQGYQKMSLYGSVNLARMASVLVLSGAYLYLGYGVYSPALGYLTWYAIAIVIYTPICLRLMPDFFQTDYTVDKPMAKGLLSFGLPVIFSSVAGVVITYTDTIMLTSLRPAEVALREVAVYNVAMPTASILWFFSSSLAIVLFPVTSELWERKYHAHLKEGIELVYRYAFMLITPLALALATFPEEVILTLFGSGFESGAPILRVLAIGAIIFTFSRINDAFFSGMGSPKTNSRIVWAGAFVNVLMNAALIPTYGMMGAAISTVSSFIVIFLIGLYHIRRKIEFDVPYFGWFKIAISGVAFTVALGWMKNTVALPMWPKIITCTLLAFVLYLIILLLTRAITITEIKTQLNRVW